MTIYCNLICIQSLVKQERLERIIVRDGKMRKGCIAINCVFHQIFHVELLFGISYRSPFRGNRLGTGSHFRVGTSWYYSISKNVSTQSNNIVNLPSSDSCMFWLYSWVQSQSTISKYQKARCLAACSKHPLMRKSSSFAVCPRSIILITCP